MTVEYGDQRPEDFRDADVWPGVVFGKTGIADFREISQQWLRDTAQAWCWDNLNRTSNFHMFGNVLNEIDYFSDYLRANAANAGNDIDALDRSTLTGFAQYLAALVEQGAERYRARQNRKTVLPWNKSLQHKCLLAVQRILRYGRETGHMDHFAGSFMITNDLLIPQVKNPQKDDAGAALPTTIIRQMFTTESIGALRALNEHMPALVRLAAETGRRPGELVSLGYDCLDTKSEGAPYLIYTETKVTGGQERRLPVLSAVIDTVREQQKRTRQRYPDTPIEHLRLFPRATMNPNGYHPMASSVFGHRLRAWIDTLPRLDSDAIGEDGQPLPFDRKLISGYSFRHTYAQRHADAGTEPDVLMALMGHERISTTMGYYRIPQKRRRAAAETVGNLVLAGKSLRIGGMTPDHRLARRTSHYRSAIRKMLQPTERGRRRPRLPDSAPMLRMRLIQQRPVLPTRAATPPARPQGDPRPNRRLRRSGGMGQTRRSAQRRRTRSASATYPGRGAQACPRQTRTTSPYRGGIRHPAQSPRCGPSGHHSAAARKRRRRLVGAHRRSPPRCRRTRDTHR